MDFVSKAKKNQKKKKPKKQKSGNSIPFIFSDSKYVIHLCLVY